MTIGEIIQAARKEAGLTQVQLGERLGVSGAMIGQWENNLRKPKSETIGRIADALGEPFTKLFLQLSEEWSKRTEERMKEIRAEDEAKGKEISQRAENEMQAKISAFTASPLGRSIISYFYYLNDSGQDEAEKRIYELARLEEYQRTEPPGTSSGGRQYTDTAKQEKPPESQIKPTDGK